MKGLFVHYHQSGNALEARSLGLSEMFLMAFPIKARSFSHHISNTLDLAICCMLIQKPKQATFAKKHYQKSLWTDSLISSSSLDFS